MNDEQLLKDKITFKSIKNTISIRIIGYKALLSRLDSPTIKQYFIDGTYKIVPTCSEIKALILIIGYEIKKQKFILCAIVLLSEESSEAYEKLYNYLILSYKFIPNIITCDFHLGNINAIKKVYKDYKVKIATCFFHLVQAWWNKLSKIGLRSKKVLATTGALVFNLKLLLL